MAHSLCMPKWTFLNVVHIYCSLSCMTSAIFCWIMWSLPTSHLYGATVSIQDTHSMVSWSKQKSYTSCPSGKGWAAPFERISPLSDEARWNGREAGRKEGCVNHSIALASTEKDSTSNLQEVPEVFQFLLGKYGPTLKESPTLYSTWEIVLNVILKET